MAKRPIFLVSKRSGEFFEEREIEFQYHSGFAVTQKAKSIQSLHQNAHKQNIANILEVSTKSDNKIGWDLSAFNLMVNFENTQISLECAFQGSKVFEGNIQYQDIYYKTSIEAKKDPRLKSSGDIIGFEFEGNFWENEPKTAFYDWMYINALYQSNPNLIDALCSYEAFTDIEFNPKKSINCQARTCAILVSLIEQNKVQEALSSKERFIEIVYPKTFIQKGLF
ncbi:MAG: hypothetical protein JXQ76_04130 [Campylobacterales bacterium]|nr:hypothetical protein [Campylobacterales bacterium]